MAKECERGFKIARGRIVTKWKQPGRHPYICNDLPTKIGTKQDP